MKKVNLKGKLGLKKETMSKFDMNQVSGGASIPNTICGPQSLLVICPQPTFKVNCTTITLKQSICFGCTITTTITTGPVGSLAC
jgi:hypothetical protein